MKQIMNKMVRRIPAVRHSYMTGAVFCGSGGGPSKIKPRSSGFASFFCLEFRCFWMTPWPRVCKNQSFRNKRNLQFLEIARFKCHTLCTRNEPAMFQLDLVCPWPVNWRSQCLVSDKFSSFFRSTLWSERWSWLMTMVQRWLWGERSCGSQGRRPSLCGILAGWTQSRANGMGRWTRTKEQGFWG